MINQILEEARKNIEALNNAIERSNGEIKQYKESIMYWKGKADAISDLLKQSEVVNEPGPEGWAEAPSDKIRTDLVEAEFTDKSAELESKPARRRSSRASKK